MQNYAERSGYGVVKNFVGHGVGRDLHEEPQVPNYYDARDQRWRDFDLRPGMTIAVEPMCIRERDSHRRLPTRCSMPLGGAAPRMAGACAMAFHSS
jgi:methionine aminopeptidase